MAAESVHGLYLRYGAIYRWLVTATGMIASFTMVLTGTIANVAVPSVMGAFGVGQDVAQFMATAFIATMTASQLLNAWFVNVFGQRGAFTIVLIIFSAGSLICATSPVLDFVIIGRIMQGFSAGVIQPLVMVTIFEVFPRERRGTAMGFYAMGLVLALGLGPLIGGLTVDALGWRYIFFVPLPLVAIALVMGGFFIPASPSRKGNMAFDWTGYVLLCTAVFFLMSAIASGQRLGWDSNRILVYFSIGGLSAIGFVRSQLRANASLLDISLFKHRGFAAAALVALVYGIGNFSTTYAIPVFGQLVQNLSPTDAGLLMLPASFLLVAIFPFTGRLSDLAPARWLIVAGLALFACGTVLLSRADVNTALWMVAFFALVSRLGMGFITPALMSTALSSIPEERLNQGSGTINFCRQLGGAFGINGLVAMMERRTEFHSDALTATQTTGNAATWEMLKSAERLLAEGGVSAANQSLVALDHLRAVIEAQATTLGFQDGFRLIAVVFLIAAIPAWALIRSEGTDPSASANVSGKSGGGGKGIVSPEQHAQ